LVRERECISPSVLINIYLPYLPSEGGVGVGG